MGFCKFTLWLETCTILIPDIPMNISNGIHRHHLMPHIILLQRNGKNMDSHANATLHSSFDTDFPHSSFARSPFFVFICMYVDTYVVTYIAYA